MVSTVSMASLLTNLEQVPTIDEEHELLVDLMGRVLVFFVILSFQCLSSSIMRPSIPVCTVHTETEN
jgi:hypothetical protein